MAAALSPSLLATTAARAAAPTVKAAHRQAPVPVPTPARTPMGEVDRVAASGAITADAAASYHAIYAAATATLHKLGGVRRNELQSVKATIDRVAAAGDLNSTRMPLAFLTLRRNREWWTTSSLLAYGARVSFPGSSLVWQSYPGEGIQVQWLGTFGKANALMAGGRHTYDGALRQLLAEATGLASGRAGGIAWESWFHFDGGNPPWASALSQGTALQAYSRAAVHLHDATLFDVARRALGIFRTAPPIGVRVGTAAGAQLLIYSFAPKLLVLNAFTQAVNGLHDYALLAKDPEGQRLYREAEAELRLAVPRYDTGAWSLYSLAPRESDLSYHTLLRDFLQGLCDRIKADRTQPGTDPATVPDPAIYCTTAQHFTADLKTPPALALVAARGRPPKAKRPLSLGYTLSKVSTITTGVTLDGKAVAGRTVTLGRGPQQLRFTPAKPGTYLLTIKAVDLAGNAAQIGGRVVVSR